VLAGRVDCSLRPAEYCCGDPTVLLAQQALSGCGKEAVIQAL